MVEVVDHRPMRETARAKQAWADYLALGPERSLEKLAASYQSATKSAPLRMLKEWSRVFGWQARLSEIADAQARAIMETGTALAHERMAVLKHVVDVLAEEFDNPDKRWLPDVKQIGSGESAKRVDIVRFNGSLIEQLRGALDDEAKETGGRQQKHELTGPNNGPILIREIVAVLPGEAS